MSVVTGEPLLPDDFSPWYIGEPNGDTLENCGVVWPVEGTWNDIDCSRKFCSFCDLDRLPDLELRGKTKFLATNCTN